MSKAVNKGGLNPKQYKFLKVYAETLNRADAYMEAYGVKDRHVARSGATQLILSNIVVKSEVERIKQDIRDDTEDIITNAGPELAETMLGLTKTGTNEDTTRRLACADLLDRMGLKPKKQVEHSGQTEQVIIINDLKGAGDED